MTKRIRAHLYMETHRVRQDAELFLKLILKATSIQAVSTQP